MQNTRYGMQPPAAGGLGRFLEGPAAWLITFVALPALIIIALLLPPVKLLDRLQAFTYTRIGATGGAVQDADGTLVSFGPEDVPSRFMISLDTTPRPEFIEGQAGRELYEAASNIPDHLIPKSPFYDLDVVGDEPIGVVLSIPIPNDSLPYETLGLYSWTGTEWSHVPSTILAAQEFVEARLSYLPPSFMVMQTAPGVPAVTMELGPDGTLPENAYVAAEAKSGLYLRGDGALEANGARARGLVFERIA